MSVLLNETAFVTEVGMTGPVNSVIGSDLGAILERFLTGMPRCLGVSYGASIMNAVLIDV